MILTEDDIEWIKQGYMNGVEYIRQGTRESYEKIFDDFIDEVKKNKDKAEKWDELSNLKPILEAHVKSLQEEKETYRKSMHQRADEWLAENIEKEKYKEIVQKIRELVKDESWNGVIVREALKKILGDES